MRVRMDAITLNTWFWGHYKINSSYLNDFCFQVLYVSDKSSEWGHFGVAKGIQEEMQFLKEKQLYGLVILPNGKRTLKNNWMFKRKSEENKLNPGYKAWIVVKGRHQNKGNHFEEILLPMVYKWHSLEKSLV